MDPNLEIDVSPVLTPAQQAAAEWRWEMERLESAGIEVSSVPIAADAVRRGKTRLRRKGGSNRHAVSQRSRANLKRGPRVPAKGAASGCGDAASDSDGPPSSPRRASRSQASRNEQQHRHWKEKLAEHQAQSRDALLPDLADLADRRAWMHSRAQARIDGAWRLHSCCSHAAPEQKEQFVQEVRRRSALYLTIDAATPITIPTWRCQEPTCLAHFSPSPPQVGMWGVTPAEPYYWLDRRFIKLCSQLQLRGVSCAGEQQSCCMAPVSVQCTVPQHVCLQHVAPVCCDAIGCSAHAGGAGYAR